MRNAAKPTPRKPSPVLRQYRRNTRFVLISLYPKDLDKLETLSVGVRGGKSAVVRFLIRRSPAINPVEVEASDYPLRELYKKSRTSGPIREE